MIQRCTRVQHRETKLYKRCLAAIGVGDQSRTQVSCKFSETTGTKNHLRLLAPQDVETAQVCATPATPLVQAN